MNSYITREVILNLIGPITILLIVNYMYHTNYFLLDYLYYGHIYICELVYTDHYKEFSKDQIIRYIVSIYNMLMIWWCYISTKWTIYGFDD